MSSESGLEPNFWLARDPLGVGKLSFVLPSRVFFPRLSAKHSFLRVIATKQFRRFSSISVTWIAFFHQFLLIKEDRQAMCSLRCRGTKPGQ